MRTLAQCRHDHSSVIAEQNIDFMEAAHLREVVRSMLAQAKHKDAAIEKLTHENAVLKRFKFAARSERFNAEQRSLLEETLDADLQAVAEEIERLPPAPPGPAIADRPSASRYRRTLRGGKCVTSPRARPAPAAAR